MTLRLRLTLWYSMVLAGIILLFGMAVYAILVISLTHQIDLSLHTAANEINRAISIDRVLDFQVVTIPQLDRFGTSSVYVQVWKTNGTLFVESDNLGDYDQPLDPEGLSAEHEALESVFVKGIHVRVLTMPLTTTEGTVLGYLQTAALLRPVDTARSALLMVLIGGGVAAIVSAAFIGWLAAHRALQPLEIITETALQITRADDLSRRIPMPESPQDEVGRLGMAFNESLERLERLFNAQRRFLADVSHELRTPLTAIRGNVDLLRRMGGADPTSLDAMQSETDRMSRLVGDLLLLAQADSGKLPRAHDLIELDTLLLEVFREAQILAGGVRVSLSEIDQTCVVGDRDLLKQLLLNLVSNALKFTPEAGQVVLGLIPVNNWARLTVTDTGIGIPPAELPHIFERFYRVDKARSRALGGAGLGLSIAQRIAHMHGGRIEAASEGIPGRGSTFSIWLPLAGPKDHSASQPQLLRSPSTQTRAPSL
jgi:two-component system OmpR family sensor kinase